jgi:hypothetical protein
MRPHIWERQGSSFIVSIGKNKCLQSWIWELGDMIFIVTLHSGDWAQSKDVHWNRLPFRFFLLITWNRNATSDVRCLARWPDTDRSFWFFVSHFHITLKICFLESTKSPRRIWNYFNINLNNFCKTISWCSTGLFSPPASPSSLSR